MVRLDVGGGSFEMNQVSSKPDQAKLFVASPSDVKAYRDATETLINEINKLPTDRGEKPLIVKYMWEVNKEAGYTEDYQQDIFKEFGTHCDIFILILWTRLGEGGTEKEYEEFLSVYRQNNPNVKLLVAHVREPCDPYTLDFDQMKSLKSFIENNLSNWAPLGRTHGAIKSVDDLSLIHI